jgi:heptosyltransferase-2
LRGLPWLAKIIPFAPRPGPVDLLRMGCVLRPHARDITVVFPHSLRAALLARLAGARRRIGYGRGGRSFLLTDAVPPYRESGNIVPIYMAKEYLDLLAPLGCTDDGQGLELRADPETVRAVQAHLSSAGPKVGIAPGAAFGPSKRWPAERFARVADMLVERLGAQCVLLTGPGEEAIRDAVLAAAHAPLVRCDEGRPSIETLKATISQLNLLICNDSGSRHIAVAFRAPTLCIMGPTSPRYSEGPYERGRVLRVDVDCGPCQKPVCDTNHCCMTRITADAVVQAAMELLAPLR